MHSGRASARALSPVAVAGLVGILSIPGCWRSDALPAEDPSRLTIQLRSSAFADGGMIPKTFTCDGSDRSPPLEWSGVPASARSLALLRRPGRPHGYLVALGHVQPAPRRQGTQGRNSGRRNFLRCRGSRASPHRSQGRNDFDKTGYGGPCPPSGTHRYFFRLYALDARLELGSTATRAEVLKAIKGHILAEGRLIGKYQRGGKE